jgi:hypothetical protein
MTLLRIDDLLASVPIDPESHLDAARVERYAGMIDALPPVVLFDTPEGVFLVDGYHRVAAARLLGLETLEAEVQPGLTAGRAALRRDVSRSAAWDLPRGSRLLH